MIAGSARGRTLKGPPRASSRSQAAIRPTSDLIRGVIFDMLDALGATYDRVLDLYAGTGALGIEALSRGDGVADFVDSNADAIALIRANLEITRFGDRAHVHRVEARHAADRLAAQQRDRRPYTLVLADPPYYDVDAFEAVRAVARSPLTDRATVFVVEHRRGVEPPPAIEGVPLYRSRRHGDTVVSIYAHQEDA